MTRRAATEEELRARREYLDHLADYARTMHHEVDHEGTECDHAACRRIWQAREAVLRDVLATMRATWGAS